MCGINNQSSFIVLVYSNSNSYCFLLFLVFTDDTCYVRFLFLSDYIFAFPRISNTKDEIYINIKFVDWGY